MRLFIGIEFPEEILNELLKVQTRIRGQAKRGRFVAKENLHLTLRFLGETPVDKLDPLIQALHSAALAHHAFSLGLKAVGSFGNGQPYRIIWVGLDGEIRNLTRLYEDVSLSLNVLEFPEETRGYQPHITLGRDVEFAREISFEEFSEAMTKLPFLVSRFSLIESALENGKRVYRSLHSFSLG